MPDESAILNARHLIATAAGNIAASAAQVSRALAWGPARNNATVDDLEVTVKSLNIAERQLVDAINELRIATRKEA